MLVTTADKCRAVIEKIVELANSGKPVRFDEDEYGNSLTVTVGTAHTHVGYRGADFELLVNNLYNSLHGGPGLSWHDSKPAV